MNFELDLERKQKFIVIDFINDPIFKYNFFMFLQNLYSTLSARTL